VVSAAELNLSWMRSSAALSRPVRLCTLEGSSSKDWSATPYISHSVRDGRDVKAK
jgi:hypothetical protein